MGSINHLGLSNAATGKLPNTKCGPGITRGSTLDLPDSLPGRWRVSLMVRKPNFGEVGHAWLLYEKLDENDNVIEVHVIGKYAATFGGGPGQPPASESGAQWDFGTDMNNSIGPNRDKYVMSSMIINNPTIAESKGFFFRNSNCATYAAEEWFRLTGEDYRMWFWSSPAALYDGIQAAKDPVVNPLSHEEQLYENLFK